MRHLLFFHRFARKGQGVAAAGEDEAGDVAVDGRKKASSAFFKIDFDVAAAELDAIGCIDLIGRRRIESQGGEES